MCVRGDHVLGAAAVDDADGQGGRGQRVDPASGARVQRDDGLRQGQDRVATAVRVGAVGGLAVDRDLERVTGRVDDAGVQRDAAPSRLRVHVRRDDGDRRLRRELAARELLRAGGIGLLARLQDREQRGRQRRLQRVCRARERDEGGHVDVVPAGVHDLPLGAVRRAGALGDGDSVELRAHRDGRPLRGADARETACALRRDGLHRQLGGDRLGGLRLEVGQLGVGVETMTKLHSARELAVDPGQEQLEQPVSRSRHSACRAPRDRDVRSTRARCA